MTTTLELEKLDQELARLPASPVTDEDLQARATLMAKRIELDQSIRRAAAAKSRPQQQGNLVVNVPPGVGISHFYGRSGRVVSARATENGLVLDLFVDEFKTLLMSRVNGLDWNNANPAALAQIAQV
jgi:hypothetical protein